MSVRHLQYFLHPKSVAVIGATDRAGSVGNVLMQNLIEAGFEGKIYPVNQSRESIHGLKTYRNPEDLPEPPDLAVIAVPAKAVPKVIADLGAKGTKAVVVITAGFSESGETRGCELQSDMLKVARAHSLRIIGPNCIGIQIPKAKLNASFAKTNALPGQIALVSQSGAMATAIVDWATSNGIGFSHVLSLGDMSDVDFGDALELLAGDEEVKAIILYVEAISSPQKFMSAAAALSKSKPIIVVKSGRFAEGARAAKSHTGALAGSDKVYDVLFRRAGILRVFDLEELFDSAETLSKLDVPKGERLAILTNGGGAGVLATDALIAEGGRLAQISSQFTKILDEILPPTWSKANPIDIIGDASAERYEQSLQAVLNDQENDAVLVMNCPTAIVDSTKVAEGVVRTIHGHPKSVFTVWLGGQTQDSSRAMFESAGIPSFATPARGVRAFMHLVRYRRLREELTNDSTNSGREFRVDKKMLADILTENIRSGRQWLSELDAKRILSAYGIPTTEPVFFRTPEEATQVANGESEPMVLKIVSSDITHKSDVGGVALNLRGPRQIETAASSMLEKIRTKQPHAKIEGFLLEKMITRKNSWELIVGINQDPQFGPVILFGEGGTAVEAIDDTSLELPPLNVHLARKMVERTRIYKRLRGFRNRPAADLNAIFETLLRISQLTQDFPEIAELDINPLLADENGVMAIDARIRVTGLTQ